MATSSITKNFVIETEEQAEKFLNALEQSFQNRDKIDDSLESVRVKHLTTPEEIRDFFKKI